MSINRVFFYQQLRENLYNDGLHQSQVDGHESILDFWEDSKAKDDDRWLAYILGTAYHETGRTMQPVRETFASSDEQASARLENAWVKGKLPWVKTPYWREDASGKYWFGRGLVQLTHKGNYENMGGLIDSDLLSDPNSALDMDVAIKIIFVGMEMGIFTGKKLSHSFNKTIEDWVGARGIVNGTESDEKVARYARSYYSAISYTTG